MPSNRVHIRIDAPSVADRGCMDRHAPRWYSECLQGWAEIPAPLQVTASLVSLSPNDSSIVCSRTGSRFEWSHPDWSPSSDADTQIDWILSFGASVPLTDRPRLVRRTRTALVAAGIRSAEDLIVASHHELGSRIAQGLDSMAWEPANLHRAILVTL